jgi:hypothetical protein
LECFRLVTVELTFAFDYYKGLLRFITLIVCFPFLDFLGSDGKILCALFNFDMEKVEWAKCIEAAQEFNA